METDFSVVLRGSPNAEMMASYTSATCLYLQMHVCGFVIMHKVGFFCFVLVLFLSHKFT